MRVRENIASGLEMRELTLYYWFFQLAEIFLLGLVVAILCVNLKVPGRTSEESHENPNICSCLQMPLHWEKSFSLGKVSWENPWIWLCWEGRGWTGGRAVTEGQRCLGEAPEQPWLCHFLWLRAENYRGRPGRRGRVTLMEAQFSSAGRRHGWM